MGRVLVCSLQSNALLQSGSRLFFQLRRRAKNIALHSIKKAILLIFILVYNRKTDAPTAPQFIGY